MGLHRWAEVLLLVHYHRFICCLVAGTPQEPRVRTIYGDGTANMVTGDLSTALVSQPVGMVVLPPAEPGLPGDLLVSSFGTNQIQRLTWTSDSEGQLYAVHAAFPNSEELVQSDVVASSYPGSMHFGDQDTLYVVEETLAKGQGKVHRIVFEASADNLKIDSSTVILDCNTAAVAACSRPVGVAFDAARNRLYIASKNGGDAILSCDMGVDGSDCPATLRLIAGGNGAGVKGSLVGTQAVIGRPRELVLSADGSRLFVAVEFGIMVAALNEPGIPVTVLFGSSDSGYNGGNAFIRRAIASNLIHQFVINNAGNEIIFTDFAHRVRSFTCPDGETIDGIHGACTGALFPISLYIKDEKQIETVRSCPDGSWITEVSGVTSFSSSIYAITSIKCSDGTSMVVLVSWSGWTPFSLQCEQGFSGFKAGTVTSPPRVAGGQLLCGVTWQNIPSSGTATSFDDMSYNTQCPNSPGFNTITVYSRGGLSAMSFSCQIFSRLRGSPVLQIDSPNSVGKYSPLFIHSCPIDSSMTRIRGTSGTSASAVDIVYNIRSIQCSDGTEIIDTESLSSYDFERSCTQGFTGFKAKVTKGGGWEDRGLSDLSWLCGDSWTPAVGSFDASAPYPDTATECPPGSPGLVDIGVKYTNNGGSNVIGSLAFSCGSPLPSLPPQPLPQSPSLQTPSPTPPPPSHSTLLPGPTQPTPFPPSPSTPSPSPLPLSPSPPSPSPPSPSTAPPSPTTPLKSASRPSPLPPLPNDPSPPSPCPSSPSPPSRSTAHPSPVSPLESASPPSPFSPLPNGLPPSPSPPSPSPPSTSIALPSPSPPSPSPTFQTTAPPSPTPPFESLFPPPARRPPPPRLLSGPSPPPPSPSPLGGQLRRVSFSGTGVMNVGDASQFMEELGLGEEGFLSLTRTRKLLQEVSGARAFAEKLLERALLNSRAYLGELQFSLAPFETEIEYEIKLFYSDPVNADQDFEEARLETNRELNAESGSDQSLAIAYEDNVAGAYSGAPRNIVDANVSNGIEEDRDSEEGESDDAAVLGPAIAIPVFFFLITICVFFGLLWYRRRGKREMLPYEHSMGI
ncbi:hypothetical protein DUNSADRAFT_15194 [Dunaliella salina]|uniref:Uncharacterized protein n=1 Tax=Dunaliella salina TaxID=3046 RepID=A0ABQ7G5V9_DUNSA|nr:hypothetical protein DUNSADRAFT_15194 [Dunaliella salina]|eukprot:KAF5830000.1 hypothetical protein DUNSADRAFT_15194 [Dunaliella salina]